MTAEPASDPLLVRPGRARDRTFSALQVHNFRVFLTGQSVSLVGTWMQFLGQGWLVYDLTGSSSSLGLTIAAQFVPVVVLAAWAGVLADRVDKRHLLMVTQASAGVVAVLLALLTMSGVIRPWMVFVLAAALGCITALEHPSRQIFVLEMVGPEHLLNAVTLHSITVNIARIIGPVIAGVAIATVGIGACFLLNALTYVAVISALLMIRVGDLYPLPRLARGAAGKFREGVRYAFRDRRLRISLIVISLVSGLGYSYDVILPVLAEETFGGGAGLYAVMVTVMGIGAMVAGLLTATHVTASSRAMSLVTVAFGAALLLAGLAASAGLALTLTLLLLAGGAGLMVMSLANTNVQLGASGPLRGRVMACWTLAFQGTRPIGALIVGFTCEAFGARAGLFLTGGAVLLTGALALRASARIPDLEGVVALPMADA